MHKHRSPPPPQRGEGAWNERGEWILLFPELVRVGWKDIEYKHIYMYTIAYIYIERERDRESSGMCTYIYQYVTGYVHLHMYVYIYTYDEHVNIYIYIYRFIYIYICIYIFCLSYLNYSLSWSSEPSIAFGLTDWGKQLYGWWATFLAPSQWIAHQIYNVTESVVCSENNTKSVVCRETQIWEATQAIPKFEKNNLSDIP